MIRTVEGVMDASGVVRLFETIPLLNSRRVLVTILDEEPASYPNEAATLSEASLGEDWNRPEEDAAWSYLQPAR
ncbi:MAG: hypothetical protein K8T91_03910 [Planctomycetes bacterium]|nr:hypothetical protein [Planctomycetota bacterium]